jgi:hypothetical protein
MWKLLHITANTPTIDGNQSPLCNKLVMANENTLFLVLGSKKNSLYLLCSQTLHFVLKMTIKKKVENRLNARNIDMTHKEALS